ncbi:hypothetical protein HBA54_21315 [Pelagibius litoralis]|uniref:ABM domain-containing protein n=1 Tax=Pelagibius litoralis TaxID=374515 RepID=A0A967K9M7_9PROT|nr:antibiotic biosynthesis monooxygenase [Pelagibius litoralis]NIA71143.1 hypothetical protein [Pelagibius litoralis]
MYARLIMMTVKPGDSATATRLSETLATEVQSLAGFHKATFFCDPRYGEYAMLSVWHSEEDAIIAGRLLCSKIESGSAGETVSQPASKLYEIYEPEIAVKPRGPQMPDAEVSAR